MPTTEASPFDTNLDKRAANYPGLCVEVGGCSVDHWNRLGFGCCSQSTSFPERPPAMVDPTLLRRDLSPIEGKEIVARFDGSRLSSDGGLSVLREIEHRLNVADRLAACIDDPRDPASSVPCRSACGKPALHRRS